MKTYRNVASQADASNQRTLGPEAQRSHARRLREGFIDKYLSGDRILDIGYRGGQLDAEPVVKKAIGVELDYPGYDGKTLPFDDGTQDAVFVSHCLEHILDYESALADWYRVLRPGGYLIIAVPHRDLYERKAELPSRFNGDHKRFYTPASLLREIERALPVAGYRVRSLRDIDEGFNYTIPPHQHAHGCYEIELVIEKIKSPFYAALLRTPSTADDVLQLCASLVIKAVHAQRSRNERASREVKDLLQSLDLPAFSMLCAAVLAKQTANDGAPITNEDVRRVVQPFVRGLQFDEARYLEANPDVLQALRSGAISSAHEHFITNGYFEGRSRGDERAASVR
jgi:SAM-dependent methyltransferase